MAHTPPRQNVSTSLDNPIQAPPIDLPAGIPGTLRITFAPGKRGPAELSGTLHRRDLDQDLRQLAELGTTVLAGFTEFREMDELQVPISSVQRQAEALGLTYRHHPISHVSVPKSETGRQEALLFARTLAQDLQRGEVVTVYCRGGLGRSAMMAAAVLTMLGQHPDQAIVAVRDARPGAVQTLAQEQFVSLAISRCRQILLGLMAADALGAATEFQSPSEIARRFPQGLRTYAAGSPFGFLPGESTDDSQMTVATLCGLKQGTQDADEVLRHFLDWLSHHPPDVGALTRSALQLAERGAGKSAGMRAWVQGGRDNAGNGGLMRIAGVYLAGLTGEALVEAAVVITALTHADPRCTVASVFLVKLLEELDINHQTFRGGAERAWQAAEQFAVRMPDILQMHGCFEGVGLTAEEYAGLLPQAVAAVGERVKAGLGGVKVRQTGFVLDTLQAALALQSGAASWLDVAQGAALAGDDSDTVACVAGAVAGARGFDVPPELVTPLRIGASWSDWQREWPVARLLALV